MKKLILSILLMTVCFLQNQLQAQDTSKEFTADIANTPRKKDGTHTVNVNKDGVILRGYDVISFHNKKPVKGSSEFSSEYEGAIYYFASAENKSKFEADKAKYAPLYNGFCAVAVALNKLSPIQLQTYGFINGKLIFQHNMNALKLWKKNAAKNAKKAEKNWAEVNEKTSYSNGYNAKDE